MQSMICLSDAQLQQGWEQLKWTKASI